MKKHLIILFIAINLFSCLKNENLKIQQNSVPENLNDGWVISSPQNEGLDEAELNKVLSDFFSERELNNSKGLLIAKNGKLIVEAYCKDLEDRDRKHNIKSVTKSLTSILTGVAIKHGLLDSNLNRTVYSFIPENFDNNLNKRLITVEHCLTMTSGLEDPFYAVSSILPGNSISTSLGVELVNSPGTKHTYNNGSANIIGGIISKESGSTFDEFTRANLFNKLSIMNYHWVKHSDDRVNPAFDLYLYPRDVLKFGQFCLQNGNWEGEQLLPLNWITKSTSYYQDGFDGKFGYHWWINDKHSCYYANGHGGQRVWIIPSKQLVIVLLAEPSTDETNLTEVANLLDKIMRAM